MEQKDDDGGKLIVFLLAIWLFFWILYEIGKAGIKGKDVTINRCGNCNMIIKPQQSLCPNCGYTILWK